MLLLLLALLQTPDSTYSTPALRQVVEEASVRNRRVPPALAGYEARVESEFGLVGRRPEGEEMVVSLEQTSNEVRWRRTGEYEQHVAGYRATQLTVMPAMVPLMRGAWTIPVLYGNRIALLFGADSANPTGRRRARGNRRAGRGDTTRAEHPLGREHERYYIYTGGDTVARVRSHGRLVELVRVHVEPRRDLPRNVVVFSGDLDLDARRLQIVRMRGRFLRTGNERAGARAILGSQLEAFAFVELENQEVNGAWWLPNHQRVEMQVAVAALGDTRSAVRVVSSWHDYRVDAPADSARLAALARGDTLEDPGLETPAADDTLATAVHRLSFAPKDSLSLFAGWDTELGAGTASGRMADFDDVAPDRWRETGRPRLDWRVRRPSDLAHYNRVEGLYTGYGAVYRFRDAAPGLAVRLSGGWAWNEGTARGQLQVERARGPWTVGARAGRLVDITNDFRAVYDSGNTIAALFGEDAYDYLDRREAAGYVARRLTRGTARAFLARLELGAARDGAMENAVTKGPIAFEGKPYRPNRAVMEGRYLRTRAQLELDPDMAAQMLKPGVGALLSVEQGSGDLDYTRLEARLLGRRQAGNVLVMLRGDAGALLSDQPPPQQLFEMGGRGPVLSGYEYKEFAGDRAALGRLLAMYTFPVLRAPIRLTRSLYLPGLAPGFSVGWQSGWASVGDRAAAAAAVRSLGEATDPETGEVLPGVPASHPTNGVKSSFDLRLRFFGGTASAGVAKAVEPHGKWRVVFGIVQEL